jgi:hypothetical protein
MATRTIVTDVHGVQMYEDGAKVVVFDAGPTEASIDAAYQARERERDDVYLKTGWRPQDVSFTPAVIIHCPRCLFSVMRATEGQAMQVLAKHFGDTHLPPHLRKAS